jgi:hypothetical protein
MDLPSSSRVEIKLKHYSTCPRQVWSDLELWSLHWTMRDKDNASKMGEVIGAQWVHEESLRTLAVADSL